MKKVIISILAASVLMTSLCACGSSSSYSSNTTTTTKSKSSYSSGSKYSSSYSSGSKYGSSSSTTKHNSGGYDMPNSSDKSFSDYVKRVDPDLYNDIKSNYDSLK